MYQSGLTREDFENREREQKLDFWKKGTELKENIITSLLSQVEVLTKDTELMERTIESLSSQLEDQKDENQKIKLSSSQRIQVTNQNLKKGMKKISYVERSSMIRGHSIINNYVDKMRGSKNGKILFTYLLNDLFISIM